MCTNMQLEITKAIIEKKLLQYYKKVSNSNE